MECTRFEMRLFCHLRERVWVANPGEKHVVKYEEKGQKQKIY